MRDGLRRQTPVRIFYRYRCRHGTDGHFACTEEKNMKKYMIKSMFYAGLLCMGLLITGCSPRETQKEHTAQEDDKENKTLQIGMSFDSFVIERWTRDRDIFVSTAEELGAEVNVQNANGVVEEQIAQIDYFIQKKMDVIVIIAIDQEALADVVRKAKNAGIKVVCYDRLISNVDSDLYISFDNYQVGYLMGRSLADALPDGGSIFAIYGSKSDHNVEEVQLGLDDALDGTGLEIVYSSYCTNWLAEMAFDAVNEGLELCGSVDGIMCGNDDLASQAIKALSEHRLAGKVVVAAQDAELSACQRIVEGTQEMTVYKPVDLLAREAALRCVALGNGEDITDENSEVYVKETISDGEHMIPYYRLEPIAVTISNMDEEIIDSGFHRREDVYLNVSGLDDTEEAPAE